MPTLNTYQLLEKELPAILMVVLVILTFTVVLIAVAILRRCWCKDEKGSREKGDTSDTSSSSTKEGTSKDKDDMMAPLWFIEIIKLYIPHIKAKEGAPHIETKEGDPHLEAKKEAPQKGIYVLRQKMKRGCFDVLLILLIPIMVGIMFITFWNVYMVEESVRGDCEMNFDCFPKIGGRFLQHEPVDNCSMFEFNGNVTYECYRLVFSYAEGLGAAGGILIFTAVLSKLYISLLVTIYKCTKDRNGCRFTLYGIVWALAVFIFILFIAISVGVPLLKETIFQTITDQIQFAMYALSLLVIIVSGVIVAIGIEIEKKTKIEI